MPSTVLSGSFSNHLAPGLRSIIGAKLGGRESYYSRLYNVGTSMKKYEDYLAAAGLPIATEKPETQDIQTVSPLEGNTKRLTHKTYAIGAEVSMEAWDDDLYKGGPGSVDFFESGSSAIREVGEGIADSLAERTELQAHDPFINGFSTATYTVLPDNSAPFATSHAVVSGGEGVSQSNRPSTDTDLNLTAFRAGCIQMRKWKNDQGLRIPGYSKPSVLLVTSDFEYDAMEIMRSSTRPDQPNPNVPNVTQNKCEIIADPYLTDETNSDAWFILGEKNHWEFLWRRRPSFDNFDERRARVGVFVGFMRFVAAPTHWLGSYGSTGA
jgi:hypothetical protein